MQQPYPSPDEWRPPVPTDEAVRATHEDAALAKISCGKLGYFEDPWTEQLVRINRPPSRSPLIHRGYYTRVSGIRRVVTNFLKGCPRDSPGVQIVNLGAGLDTLFFWIREASGLWRDDLVFFEVDFPEILSKKLSTISKKEGLWRSLGVTCKEDLYSTELGSSGIRELRTPNCKYVSTDMRIVQELESAMLSAGFADNKPTLFISECVLVYMQALHGDAILQWAAAAVPDAPSAMVMYEQTKPDDAFGKVMVENLMKRGCPLLSIFDYPSLDAQRERFIQRGWEQCQLRDMNEVYKQFLEGKDVERIQRLELMDEFEEWHLIQGHYFLAIASRSGASDSPWVHEIAACRGDGVAHAGNNPGALAGKLMR